MTRIRLASPEDAKGSRQMRKQIVYTDSPRFTGMDHLDRNYVDLSICYCGKEHCMPGHAIGPQKRIEYVIHVVTKGRGIFRVNGKTWSLSENHAFLIYPETEVYYEADKDEPWSYMWVGFQGIQAHACMAKAGFLEHSPVLHLDSLAPLTERVEGMLKAHQLSFANELKRNSELLGFLAELIGQRQQEEEDKEAAGSVYVEHTIRYLTQNYARPVKISELADYIGVNRSHLAGLFKKHMGISPQEFLLSIRMEKAASLLTETTLSVQEVAARAGYPDALAFSKIFKKRFGKSPKNYRNDEVL